MNRDPCGIAMIGAGQMASALAIGFVERGGVAPAQIRVHDPVPEALGALAARLPGIVRVPSNREAVEGCGIAVLAVKPGHAATVAAELAGRLPADAVLVSVVAGLRLDTLGELFQTGRVIRVMPNTPCLVGSGSCVVCRTTAVAEQEFERVRSLLATTGSVHVVAEPLMDAATGLSGSGPAFVAVMIEALADGGVRAGLPREMSLRLACEILAGTAALVRQTGDHPAVIKDRVASPAGTTVEGLAILEQMAVRSALSGAVAAAARRSAELARS
jgi:pyrroline-5-carboxylate reductase